MAPVHRDTAASTVTMTMVEPEPELGVVLVPSQGAAQRPEHPLPVWWPYDHGGVLGAIRVERRHARGGTGVIYRAVEIETGRRLAIKLPRPDCPTAPQSISSEIEALREIHSPFVVGCEGSGVAPDGRPWLAMELLEGQSIKQRISTRDLIDLDEVVRCLRQACMALGAVHDAGWVHFDVKPSNLLFTSPEDQHVKLVDFGIARRIGECTRMLCGTPDYIAPEQTRGEPADPRSDLYALGCCAYEMLTGRRLVSEVEPMAKVRAHVEGVQLRWSEISELPLRLQAVLAACLSYRPGDRPRSAYDVEDALCRVAMTLADERHARSSPLHGSRSPEDTTVRDGVLPMVLPREATGLRATMAGTRTSGAEGHATRPDPLHAMCP